MENKKIDVADLVPYLGQVVRIGSEHVRLHAILADGVVEAPQGYYRKASEVALPEVAVPEFVVESGPVVEDLVVVDPLVDVRPIMDGEVLSGYTESSQMDPVITETVVTETVVVDPESSPVDPEAIPVQDDPEPVQPEVDPFSTVEHELKPLATGEVVERGEVDAPSVAPSAPFVQGPDENFSF